MNKTKFKITITYADGEVEIFKRDSICENFFVAIENDLIDIGGIIFGDDCIEYDFEIIK